MFERIMLDPAVMAGVPCIRGMRVPVATVVGTVAEGMTTDEILDDFPYLEREDIAEALQYAAEAVRETPAAARGRRVRFLVDASLSFRVAEAL